MSQADSTSLDPKPRTPLLWGAIPLVLCFIWSYWPTLVSMVSEWTTQPDYSHGFLVVPIALYFLWRRRDRFPLDELRISPVGLLMLGGVFGLRYAAGKYYLESLDGWTIPLWIAGAVWMLAGWQCVRWALSSVLFLYFMIPLPYSIGRMFSLPLQTVATRISTFCLQILGQPAIAEGHTIWIDKRQLFVEEACSGLRILLGIAALAVGLVMLTQWNPWQKLAVVIFAIPVAIAANAIRIVIIGLLHAWELEKSIVQQGHDLTGIMMIPLAAIMLLLIGQFAGKLFRESQVVSPFAMGRD